MDIDVVIDWTDEKPPSAHEAVEWIPPSGEGIPVYDELIEWTIKGKVRMKFLILFYPSVILNRLF